MRLFLLCSLLLLAACQSRAVLPPPQPLAPLGREHAEFGQIYDLRTGEQISPERLLGRLVSVQRVLLGERHDNPDHHALLLWLLRGLATYRAQGSILMEMINPEQQAHVVQAQHDSRAGIPPQDPIAALAWQPGWSWSLYGPLVMHALRQPYPLMAANLDRDEIRRIYQQRPKLTGERSNATQVQQRLLEDIRRSHCDMLPQSQLPAMLAVQQQRDRRMAEAMLTAPQPSLLLAGSFHVRKDLGVPLHLADLQAPGSQAVLLLAEVGQKVNAQMADYVWYTARMPEEDFCARFKR